MGSALRGAGPAAAEAECYLHSWSLQLNLADELGKALALSQSSIASSVALDPNLEFGLVSDVFRSGGEHVKRSSSEEPNVTGVKADATSQPASSAVPCIP